MKYLWIAIVICWGFQVTASPQSFFDLKLIPEKAAEVDHSSLKTIKAVKLNSSPVMDGRLDDAVWQNVSEINSFIVLNTKGKTPASLKTQVKLAYTTDNLFFGVKCEEPNINELKVKCHEYGSDVWGDDCVEFWIDPTGDGKTAFHIAFNSLGTVGDLKEVEGNGKVKADGSPWHSETTVKIFKGDLFWSAEVQVPFKNIEIPNSEFISAIHTNIARERRSAGGIEYSSWTGNFAYPIKKFGLIELDPPLLEAKLLGWGAYCGPNRLTLKMKNNSKEDQNITVKIAVDPSMAGSIDKEYVLKSGSEEILEIPYSFDKGITPYAIKIAIYSGNRELLLRKYSGVILPPLSLKIDGNQFYLGKDKKFHGSISIRLEQAYLKKLNIVIRLLEQEGKIISESQMADIQSSEVEFNCDLDTLKNENTYKIEVMLRENDKELFKKDTEFDVMAPPF